MARQTVVSYLDDMDGSAAEGEVPFSVNGVNYVIDLSAENAEKLREAFAPFVAAARRVTSGRTAGASRSTSSAPSRSREENQIARTWLAENGYEISSRGRISNELWAAFESKTPAQKLDEPSPVEEVPVAEAPVEEKPKRTRRAKASTNEQPLSVVEFKDAAAS